VHTWFGLRQWQWDDKVACDSANCRDDSDDPVNPFPAEILANNTTLLSVSTSRHKPNGSLTKMLPITPPRGAPAPKHPNATSLALPGGNVTPRIPSAVGAIAAAASPCSPRKMSKPISFGTNGVMIEVTAKNIEPHRKMSRRPNTSARRPHRSCISVSHTNTTNFKIRTRKQPNVRLYAETIHCCLLVGTLSALPTVGRLMIIACTEKVCGCRVSRVNYMRSR
jgi:hypothetical protein